MTDKQLSIGIITVTCLLVAAIVGLATPQRQPFLGQCVSSDGFYKFSQGTIVERIDRDTYVVLISTETSANTYNVVTEEMGPCIAN